MVTKNLRITNDDFKEELEVYSNGEYVVLSFDIEMEYNHVFNLTNDEALELAEELRMLAYNLNPIVNEISETLTDYVIRTGTDMQTLKNKIYENLGIKE